MARARKAVHDPAVFEQISKIEATLSAVKDQGHRFLLLAATLEAQVNELKLGPAPAPPLVEDWKEFTQDW